jgi:hypothetical protein
MVPTLWTFFIGCGKKVALFLGWAFRLHPPFSLSASPVVWEKSKPNSCPYCAGWITEQLIVCLTGIAINSGESGRQEHDAWKRFLWGQMYCCQIALHTFHSGVLVIPFFVSLVKPLVISACFMGSGLHFSLWVQHCHLTSAKLPCMKIPHITTPYTFCRSSSMLLKDRGLSSLLFTTKYIIHTRAHLQTAG